MPSDNRPSFYEEVIEEIKRCYPLDGQTTAFLITLILINTAYNIIR